VSLSKPTQRIKIERARRNPGYGCINHSPPWSCLCPPTMPKGGTTTGWWGHRQQQLRKRRRQRGLVDAVATHPPSLKGVWLLAGAVGWRSERKELREMCSICIKSSLDDNLPLALVVFIAEAPLGARRTLSPRDRMILLLSSVDGRASASREISSRPLVGLSSRDSRLSDKLK
jgi:hypothetical protein